MLSSVVLMPRNECTIGDPAVTDENTAFRVPENIEKVVLCAPAEEWC